MTNVSYIINNHSNVDIVLFHSNAISSIRIIHILSDRPRALYDFLRSLCRSPRGPLSLPFTKLLPSQRYFIEIFEVTMLSFMYQHPEHDIQDFFCWSCGMFYITANVDSISGETSRSDARFL